MTECLLCREKDTQAAVLSLQIKVLTEKISKLTDDFELHRKEVNATLVGVKSKLDMARGGYFVLALLVGIWVYAFDGIKNAFGFFHHAS